MSQWRLIRYQLQYYHAIAEQLDTVPIAIAKQEHPERHQPLVEAAYDERGRFAAYDKEC